MRPDRAARAGANRRPRLGRRARECWSGYMVPASALRHIADRCSLGSQALGYGRARHAERMLPPYLPHYRNGELSVAVSLPPRLPRLGHLVGDVGGVRAQHEVFGVTASPNIASVEDVQPWGGSTVSQFPGNAVDAHMGALPAHTAVSPAIPAAHPEPAPTRAGRPGHTEPERSGIALVRLLPTGVTGGRAEMLSVPSQLSRLAVHHRPTRRAGHLDPLPTHHPTQPSAWAACWPRPRPRPCAAPRSAKCPSAPRRAFAPGRPSASASRGRGGRSDSARVASHRSRARFLHCGVRVLTPANWFCYIVPPW